MTSEDLRRSRELLDTIIACAPLGFALFDREMRYVRVNQALAAMHGLPEDDHVGRSPAEIVPRLAEQVLGVFRRVLDAEEPVEDVEVSGHIPTDPGVEHHLLLTWYPVRHDDEVVGVGVFVNDITDRVRAERGLKLLADVGEALDTALGVEERLERLAELLVPTLADFCTIEIVGPDERGRVVASAAVEGAQAGEPSELVEVPLVARGRRLGTLNLGNSVSGRRYDDRDATLIRQLGWRAGLAIDNARLYEIQRHIAVTLQRGILPPELPEIPGVEAAARFSPMGDGLEVGGDFYDLFPVGDAWAAVIGDVCGKGAEAASLTALARHGIRTLSRGGTAPADVLLALNEVIVESQGLDSRFSTAAYARLAPGDGSLTATVASAGHPLPLIVRRDGGVETLGEPGMLLGPFAEIRVTERAGELRAGDALVLYTDGVTEARGAREMFGEERLRELLSRQAGRSAHEIAAIVERSVVAFHGGPLSDDLAVLVLRVVEPSAMMDP